MLEKFEGINMKKAMVTGADGFIGHHLVMNLLENNIETYAVTYPGRDQIYQSELKNPLLHLVSMDLNNIFDYYEQFPYDIDVMYHFAWNGVKPEMRSDLGIQMGNINLTMQCMRFAANKRIKKVIFPGSTNEYLYYGKPLNKDAVPTPSDAYGSVKVALRYLCGQFAKQNDLSFIYTIIAGIYASDRRDNNVIFYTIDKLLDGEKPSLTALEQRWDYVYIDDVIQALLAVGKRGKDGGVYAVGHGDNWPLANYIKIIHKKINPELPLGIGEKPYSGGIIPTSCIDLTDITNDTGFVPRVSFEEGISKVITQIVSERRPQNE